MKEIEEEKLAPIVLFTYCRPKHTFLTIEALRKCILANKSDLIVFSDAPKNELKKEEVYEVRKILHDITGFRNVKIIEQTQNKGLARSIIEGVTEIIEQYGKIIVLEDDIVVGKHFLEFMNIALNKYSSNKDVWHITGWRDPVNSEIKNTAYFYPTMDCWSWGTWSDRWVNYKKNPVELKKQFTRKMKYDFNLQGSDNLMFLQVEKNITGEINTWAIFWYATIFLNKGLCVGPSQSLVRNIGFDNTGENCGYSEGQIIHATIDTEINTFPNEIKVNASEYELNKKFLKKLRYEEFNLLRFIYNHLPGKIRIILKKIKQKY